jgi:cytochrome c peroxidase
MPLTRLLFAASAGLLPITVGAQAPIFSIPSLKTVKVPAPAGLERYVSDTRALVVLGKAFFWDVQASSDGRIACGTCHFHAGADHRSQNQLSSPPGINTPIAPNQILSLDMFPFRKLANPNDNGSTVVSEVRQTAGSAGQFHRTFRGLVPGSAAEDAVEITGEPNFTIDGLSTRQVTARNAPSVINAVLNVRNFWDGRASPIFTGATPFGDADTRANLVALGDAGLQPERVRLDNSSLASLSVGPPVNSTEMSYEGRTWPIIGRKLLGLAPLGRQHVDAGDSVLGALAKPAGPGLLPGVSYSSLIQAAFQSRYWGSQDMVDIAGNPADSGRPAYTQMEFNFSFFWGVAVQAYMSTLISDDARTDQFAEGRRDTLTLQEQQGMSQFVAAHCATCHLGPQLTSAAVNNPLTKSAVLPSAAGFNRTGVSPIAEDIGFGGTDSFGNPLFSPQGEAMGAFKTPGFRNIELTGPYFHNGSQATLEQVIDFYGRHGDIPEGGLSTGITTLLLTAEDKAAMIVFMKALTDDRVRYERAPFDHPELCVPMGHVTQTPDTQFQQSAMDKWVLVPASGANGNAAPLQTFQELLLGIGNDGSRAHGMTQSCVP